MQKLRLGWCVLALPVLLLSGEAAAREITSYSPVTDQRLANPEPGNWLMYRRTYDGANYSPLNKINAGNVKELTPVWTFSTGVTEGHEAPPIINNGVMFDPGRNGYLWTLERGADAIKFVDAVPFVHQDVFKRIDPKTGRPEYNPDKVPAVGKTVTFCPSLWGGKDWPSASYSASTGLLYIPAIDNMCGSLTGEKKPLIEGQLWLGADIEKLDLSVPRPVPHLGELQAWDVAGGKKVWSHKFPAQLFASVLSTAGDLVFVGGTSDRYFRAFNAKTGELLWQHKTNSGIMGNPVAFEVDGVQYIAVQSGWGVDGQRIQIRLPSSTSGSCRTCRRVASSGCSRCGSELASGAALQRRLRRAHS